MANPGLGWLQDRTDDADDIVDTQDIEVNATPDEVPAISFRSRRLAVCFSTRVLQQCGLTPKQQPPARGEPGAGFCQ